MLRCRSLPFLATLFFVSCQGNGGPRILTDLTPVLKPNREGRPLTVRPIDGQSFLVLRGHKGKGPRRLFVENGETVRALAPAPPADAILTSPSNVVNGRVLLASILPVTKDEADSRARTWWTVYDLKTGEPRFRKPCRWEGREPAELSFQASPLSPVLHADGSFAALVAFREGVKLQKYDAEGNFVSEHGVVPQIPGSLRLSLPLAAGLLRALPDGGFLAVTPFYRAEFDAVKKNNGQPPTPEGDSEDEIVGVLKLDAGGRIVSSTALNFGKYSADLQSISLKGQRLAIGGNIARGTGASKGFVTVVLFDEEFQNVIRLESKPYRLTNDEDTIVGVALLDDGRVLVAGNAGIQQAATHSVVGAGKPFLSLIDTAATELGFQWLDTTSLEVVGALIEGDKGPYLLGHRNPPLTHGTSERLTTSLFSVKVR